MDREYWQNRWRDGQIGFHQEAGNPSLTRFAPQLLAGLAHPRILVPLCGKSRDMTLLASEGCQVTGVELVEDALKAFFEEQRLQYRREERAGLPALVSGAVRAFIADFFALTPDAIGPQDGAYDRAAFIALPEETRGRYAEHLLGLLSPGARILLIG